MYKIIYPLLLFVTYAVYEQYGRIKIRSTIWSCKKTR